MKKSQSPESNAIPECRHGTRSYNTYVMCYMKGNAPRAAYLAKPRMFKKARKLVDADMSAKGLQGRVLRACVRQAWIHYGEYCDAQMHGGY